MASSIVRICFFGAPISAAAATGGCAPADEAASDDDGAPVVDDSQNNEVNAGPSIVNLEKEVASAAKAIHAQAPDLAVYAPSDVPGTPGKVFVSGKAYKSGADGKWTYAVNFDLTNGCNGSTACSMGGVTSSTTAPWFKPNAGVDQLAVMFHEMSCGASCAPPGVTWTDARKSTYYTISLKGASRDTLTNLVRSAMKGGARK